MWRRLVNIRLVVVFAIALAAIGAFACGAAEEPDPAAPAEQPDAAVPAAKAAADEAMDEAMDGGGRAEGPPEQAQGGR